MLYQLWSTQTSIRLNCTELRNVSDASQISGTLSADVCSPVSISGFFSLTIRLRMKVFLNLQSFVLRTKKDFYFDAIFFFICLFGLKMLPFLGRGGGNTGTRVLPRNFRNSFLFTATCKNSPSAGCVSAVNHFVERRRYVQETDCFFKTNSALICGILISTYLSVSQV